MKTCNSPKTHATLMIGYVFGGNEQQSHALNLSISCQQFILTVFQQQKILILLASRLV